MRENPRLLTRWFAIALLPVALAVMLPLVLLVGALLYVRGFVYALVNLAASLLGREPVEAESPLQEPHFRDAMRVKARLE